MNRLRIIGGTIVTLDPERRVIEAGEVEVNGGWIEYVGPVRESAGEAEVIEASGKAVLPGLVNAHTHAAMTLMRSYADDMPLQPWLETMIWPLEAHLTGEDVYWGTMLGAVEMIRGGVTCFHDMYWYAGEAARAGLTAGMRVAPCGVLIGVLPNADDLLAEAIETVDGWLSDGHPRLHASFGPHAPYTVPDAYLERVIAAAAERHVPVHIHLSETAQEVADSVAAHGETPALHMDRVGLFEVHAAAAHCVHLTPEEIDLMAAKGAGVLVNHTSNLKLGGGVPPVPALLDAGATVGLGTDGAASNNNLDILEEVRLAALLHKGLLRDATVVSAVEALEMATWGSAAAVGIDRLGRLLPGWRADVITVDLSAPHLCPGANVVADLVYAAQSSDVTDVVIGGEVVMRDRQVTKVDQAEVVAKARETAQRLYSRVGG